MNSPAAPRWPRWGDPAIALAVASAGAAELLLSGLAPPVQVVGAVAMGLVLVRRRVTPIAVVAAVLTLLLSQQVAGYEVNYGYTPLAIAIACYSSGAHRPLRAAVSGLVLAVILLVAGTLVEGLPLSEFLFPALIAAMPWAGGIVVRFRVLAARSAEDRAVRAEQHQEQRAAAAVVEERARIARELHDLVAHSVSVMVMQAGALRRMLPADSSRELAVVSTVEQIGREALVEMRRMLELLREEDAEGAPLAPQPGLARLGDLVDRTRAAGVGVEVGIDDAGPLPPGLDMCAYRIVQESLTNVIKHAGPAQARILIRRHRGQVEMEIVDDGRGGPVDVHGGGHGLVGMEQRVALFGGHLEAGPEPHRGFAVRVRLPVTD